MMQTLEALFGGPSNVQCTEDDCKQPCLFGSIQTTAGAVIQTTAGAALVSPWDRQVSRTVYKILFEILIILIENDSGASETRWTTRATMQGQLVAAAHRCAHGHACARTHVHGRKGDWFLSNTARIAAHEDASKRMQVKGRKGVIGRCSTPRRIAPRFDKRCGRVGTASSPATVCVLRQRLDAVSPGILRPSLGCCCHPLGYCRHPLGYCRHPPGHHPPWMQMVADP